MRKVLDRYCASPRGHGTSTFEIGRKIGSIIPMKTSPACSARLLHATAGECQPQIHRNGGGTTEPNANGARLTVSGEPSHERNREKRESLAGRVKGPIALQTNATAQRPGA